ncbi:hypothetical protein Tco_0513026, partial [Tanacetum coccineum]
DDKMKASNAEQPKANNSVQGDATITMDNNSGVNEPPMVQEGIQNKTKSKEDKATHCFPSNYTNSSTSFVDALNAAGNLENRSASSLGSDPSKLVRF